MNKPLILVTNDDGITAPGIRNLVNFMNEIGDVVVVAPNSPQSGKGHAITINSTLTFEEINLEGPQKDISLSGTPVDCVKFALDKVLTRKPDLVVSGINHGANSSLRWLRLALRTFTSRRDVSPRRNLRLSRPSRGRACGPARPD